MADQTPSVNVPRTIITTHLNADFDAVASVLAAQKLYPGSVVVLPESNEKNIRNFFISSMAYLFNMTPLKAIETDAVTRLVLVDTRQSGRIGALSKILDKPDLTVDVYDHHPASSDDVRADYLLCEPVGATVTLLTELIQKKELSLTPDEATVMALGIYEDTGSFTFLSTTARDFQAAAWLLSQGVNLSTVSNMISRELTPVQIGLLNKMIKNAWHHTINDTVVVVSAMATEEYVPDVAFLVHKMQKMEGLEVLFLVAQMAGKIYIIGRSRTRAVNAGRVLSVFGGGGHAYAASASTRQMTLAQAEQTLLEALRKHIQATVRARDIMSSPVITAPAGITCRQAGELLTRYNINTLVIVAEEKDGEAEKEGEDVLGFISRQVIEKALYHQLGEAPVQDYMTTEFSLAAPTEELWEIQEKIIEHNQRLLPVVRQGKLQGVITRTDLLNILVDQRHQDQNSALAPMAALNYPKTKNVRKTMQERLSQPVFDLLRDAGQVAREIGVRVYVVGGFVRDLFLYRSNADVDLVVEGDGIAFAEKFAATRQARYHFHQKFGTAVITLAEDFRVDVASARLEYYQFPAALPTVEMSSIKLDLFRRDFTVNTLAICLNPDKFGTLIDFFSGQRDIKEGTIRVLHNLSLVEDPTRVFRAVRFEQRFGFTIGKMTLRLIENAVKMDFFKRLSGRRVFGEISQILQEDNPVPAIQRLARLNLLGAIHPLLELDKKTVSTLNAVREVLAWYDLLFLEDAYRKWAVYLLALLHKTNQETAEAVAVRFELTKADRHLLGAERLAAERLLSHLKHSIPLKNSTLYEWLESLPTELILYIMAVAGEDEVQKHISRYFLQLKNVKPDIRGKDLQQMGISPGPIYSRILKAVRAARLDGEVSNREEELALVRDYVGTH